MAAAIGVEIGHSLDCVCLVACTAGSDPAPGDLVAVVEHVIGICVKGWLRARAGNESVFAGECYGTELEKRLEGQRV